MIDSMRDTHCLCWGLTESVALHRLDTGEYLDPSTVCTRSFLLDLFLVFD